MNQELIDRIQQDAVTIQRLTADLDSIKQEQARNYNEKLQAEELRYSRLLSETSAKLIGCGKRIDSLENQLETVRKCARANGWTEEEPLADFLFRTAEDRNEARKRLEAIYHAANAVGRGEDESDESVASFIFRMSGLITKELQNVAEARNRADEAQRFAEDQKEKLQEANQRIANLLCEPGEAVNALRELESVANDNERKQGESVRDFITRTVAELTHALTAISLIQNRAIIYGCKKEEPVIDFLSRMNSINNELRQRVRFCDDAADKNGCGRTEETAEFIGRMVVERNEARKVLKAINDAANVLGCAEDESVSAFMSRMSDLVAKEQRQADESRRELSALANERAQEISKLRGTHADDIARIDKLSAQLAEIEAEATECGRDEGESVPKFMSRLVSDLGDERASSMAMSNALAASKEDVARERDRGNRINAEYEADMKKIMTTANELGRADYEALDAFMRRQYSAIAVVKSDVRQVYAIADTLGRTSSESIPDFMKRQAEEIAKATKLAELRAKKNDVLRNLRGRDAARMDQISATLREIEAKTLQCGRESDELVVEFLARQDSEIDKEGVRAFEASEALTLVRQELQDKSQQLLKVQGWHEENLQKIKSLEGDCARLQSSIMEACEIAKANGRTEAESLGWFVERICADRDLIRAELAAILVEANKSGRCNGDPVQLLKAGQNDLDARIAADREAEDIKKRWRSLNDHAALKGMRGDETTAEFITRQHRLAADRQTALDRASETIAALTSDLTSAIVDKALAGTGAKEINRLSALVAELQVALDDAKSQYGGIMAQLGNETPLQLIERMKRLAQDPRASTIPHDERAMLVAESADLRKRLEESQKAHAKTEHELRGKLRAALATVENQSAAIAESKQATEKYTAVVEEAAKLKDWASTIRHKVLVAMVHTKAMAEYDTIMKELDGGKVPQ